MNCEYSSETAWEKIGGGKDQIAISLDLETQDLLAAETAGDIRESLESNRDRIKADILNTVKADVLAPILSKAALDARNMGQEVEDNSAIPQARMKNDYKTTSKLEDGGLNLNSAMEIKMDLDSGEDIHPIVSLKNSVGELAANIAEVVCVSLEKIYGETGKTEHRRQIIEDRG